MKRLPGNPRFFIRYDRSQPAILRWDVFHYREPEVPMISLKTWREAIDWVYGLEYTKYVAYSDHVEHFYCKPRKKEFPFASGSGTLI